MCRRVNTALVLLVAVAVIGTSLANSSEGFCYGRFGGCFRLCCADLTEEQCDAIEAKVKEMEEAGASRTVSKWVYRSMGL